MEQNKVRTYLLYAVGEIALVMIGILLALQVNNWNEVQKNAAQERYHLVNLQLDLQADSVRLFELNIDFKKAVCSKMKFEDFLSENSVNTDSLSVHFMNQYFIGTDFIPNSTTIDELKNSSGLNLITNPQLRRQIVTLYNSYDELGVKLKLGLEKGQIIMRYSSDKLEDINNPKDEEIEIFLRDKFFANQTRVNYLSTQSIAVSEAYRQSIELLELIRKELNDA